MLGATKRGDVSWSRGVWYNPPDCAGSSPWKGMRRFPPPERRPRREVPRPEGPFDRLLRRRPERDPAPLIIGGTIAFLALIIALVFVFSSLLGGDEGGERLSG